VGFEPTISAGERPQTYALDRADWDRRRSLVPKIKTLVTNYILQGYSTTNSMVIYGAPNEVVVA
jgi:hypothetical protein